MDKVILNARFKSLAISIFKSIEHQPYNGYKAIIFRQLVASSTSAAANYRAACKAKSPRDFVNKLKIVEEEIDETTFWLEYSRELNLFVNTNIDASFQESNELVAIIAASLITIKSNYDLNSKKPPANKPKTNNQQ